MNIITDEFIISNTSKKDFDDAKWEYSDVDIKIIKKTVKDNGSFVYNINIKNKVDKMSVLITIDKEIKRASLYCPCKACSKNQTCKHVAIALIAIQEDLDNELKIIETSQTDVFKLELLKSIYQYDYSHDYIKLYLDIKETDELKIMIGLKVGLVGKKSYVIKNINSFINDVDENKMLNLGKECSSHNYELEKQSINLFNYVKSLVLKYPNLTNDYITYKEFNDLISTVINQEVYYLKETYLVKNHLDDIVLDIICDDQDLLVKIRRATYYKQIGTNVVFNLYNRVFYYLDNRQLQKIKLINTFLEENMEFRIGSNETENFIKDVLPNVYNEFDIKLDHKLDLEIVAESLSITLFCYLEDKIIHIKPKFIYGEYDIEELPRGIVVKRNYYKENQVIDFLIQSGYLFDVNKNVFIIEADRNQFNFLTKHIFNLRDEYDTQLDDRLKAAILKYDSNQISIGVKHDGIGDYFDFDLELNGIDIDEIDGILASYELKREYHKLNNQMFMKLNDQRLYMQLLFIKEVIGDATHTLNTYRVPKYRAILIKERASGLFNHVSYNSEFMDYVDSITMIESLPTKAFESNDYQLREYQKTGIEWLTTLYKANLGALLADEMGLGKTIQVISFLKINEINNCLIVVPKALLYNWENEFKKFHPDQNVIISDGDAEQRIKKLKNVNKDIIITSYSTIINDFDSYQTMQFDTIIIDEAQYIKNSSTKTARVIKQLKANFFIALTGTPIENNLIELWSIFDYTIPGFLSDSKTFNSNYVDANLETRNKLKKILAPFIMRRLKKDVLKEIPDKVVVDMLCEMNPIQKGLYQSYVQKINTDNKNIFGKNIMEVLTAITRLRQLSIDPSLFLDDYTETSGKIELFKELINEINDSGEKVIVFSQYTTMLKKLGRTLEDQNIKYYYLDGETKAKQRMMDVERFNKSKIPVYLISLKAGGVGLNLTSANNVIIMDPWWNPAVENQAIDRSHRIGQNKVVQVFRLISRGTIEEKIYQLQNIKQEISGEILDNDEVFINKMSTDDIKNLLL
jgi:SNF2 family DNA or RNA helicase